MLVSIDTLWYNPNAVYIIGRYNFRQIHRHQTSSYHSIHLSPSQYIPRTILYPLRTVLYSLRSIGNGVLAQGKVLSESVLPHCQRSHHLTVMITLTYLLGAHTTSRQELSPLLAIVSQSIPASVLLSVRRNAACCLDGLEGIEAV